MQSKIVPFFNWGEIFLLADSHKHEHTRFLSIETLTADAD